MSSFAPDTASQHSSPHRAIGDVVTLDVRSRRQSLARFMFDRQADDYQADDGMRELAWADDRIRDFWIDQARAVLGFLQLDVCT